MNRNRMKLRAIGSLLLLFLFFNTLSAQNKGLGTVIGTIVSIDNEEAIPFVSVGVKGTNKGGYTDEDGKFSIRLEEGKYTLKFTYIGYESTEKSVTVKANQTVDLGNIILTVSSQTLDEVVVSSMYKKFAQKKSDYVARMPLKNIENPQVYTVIPQELLSEQIAVDFRSVLTASPGVASGTLGVGSGGTGCQCDFVVLQVQMELDQSEMEWPLTLCHYQILQT